MELPVATLRPSASQGRYRVLAIELRRWLAQRWAWLAPRSVPMIVAFAGLVAVLGATKYLSVYASGSDLMLRAPAGAHVPANDFASRDPDTTGFGASQLSGTACDALVQALPDRWPDHERRLHLASGRTRMTRMTQMMNGEISLEVPADLALHRPCSLVPARVR